MFVDVNYWAVLVATVSTLLVGSFWYARGVFGATWARLAGVDLDNAAGAVAAIVTTAVVSFISALVLGIAVQTAWLVFGGSYLLTSLVVGFLLWAAFTAARFITHDAFERRPMALTLLNISHELVTVLVMALIIGVWPPIGAI